MWKPGQIWSRQWTSNIADISDEKKELFHQWSLGLELWELWGETQTTPLYHWRRRRVEQEGVLVREIVECLEETPLPSEALLSCSQRQAKPLWARLEQKEQRPAQEQQRPAQEQQRPRQNGTRGKPVLSQQQFSGQRASPQERPQPRPPQRPVREHSVSPVPHQLQGRELSAKQLLSNHQQSQRLPYHQPQPHRPQRLSQMLPSQQPSGSPRQSSFSQNQQFPRGQRQQQAPEQLHKQQHNPRHQQHVSQKFERQPSGAVEPLFLPSDEE